MEHSVQFGHPLEKTGDPVARLPEAPQLLDIQVQQIAGRRVLIAHHRWRRLQLGQPMQADPPQAASHGADGQAQLERYLLVQRARRCSITRCTSASGVAWGQCCGRDERSRKPASPSSRKRLSHL